MFADASVFLDRRRRLLEAQLASTRAKEQKVGAEEARLRQELAPLPASDERARALATRILEAASRSVELRDEEIRIAKMLAALNEKRPRDESTVLVPRPLPRKPSEIVRPAVLWAVVAVLAAAWLCAMVEPAPLTYPVYVPGPVRTSYVRQVVPGPMERVPVPFVPKGYARLPAPPPNQGWAVIDAAPGTRVYEKRRLLGVAPMILALPRGEHTVHFDGIDDGERWTDDETFEIMPGETTRVGTDDDEQDLARLL